MVHFIMRLKPFKATSEQTSFFIHIYVVAMTVCCSS